MIWLKLEQCSIHTLYVLLLVYIERIRALVYTILFSAKLDYRNGLPLSISLSIRQSITLSCPLHISSAHSLHWDQ